ncbi:MAG: hypothetical protein KY391_00580 [Actinobacteria bacterium]|nr:hypothetical protein [Actinomycetota bacterium]
MPFWKRKIDPEVAAARARAEAALPAGWRIYRSDREQFDVPKGRVITYGICAAGPSGETALVVAVGEANSYRHFERFMRGHLDVAEGWSVPLVDIEPNKPYGSFHVRHEDDADVIAAKQELDDALPDGWELYDSDRERYFFPSGYLETWAVTARGPGDEGMLVMGLGEAGGFRQLAKALRRELPTADAWAPPMQYLTAR